MTLVRFVLLAFLVVPLFAQNVCKMKQVMNTTSHYEVFNCTIEANIIDVQFTYRPFSIIEHIFFNGSRVKYLPQNFFAPFELLLSCNLTRSGLEELHRGGFKQAKVLRVLDLHGNEVKQLENSVFDGAFSLQWLNLTANRLEQIDRHAFAGLHILRHLLLANNKLTMLEANLLDDLGELITLNLSGNRISNIPVGFFDLNGNLKVLDLSYNCLHAFDVYVPVNQLCYLSLDGNKVDELILHLNETVANECGAAATSPIIVVTANGNNIRKLVLPKFFSIDVLSLNGNQISDVHNVTEIVKLRQLHMNYNPIDRSAIDNIIQRLTKLRHLSLAGVHITELDFRIFANLTDLIELDVSSNRLPTLDLTDVYTLQHLHKLNISNNQLMHIDFDYLRQHFPKLKVIDINHNQFGCDILKDMLHVSFKRQRINAIPRPGPQQVKNQPNVDGIFCLQELNTGHLQLFEQHLEHNCVNPLETSLNTIKSDMEQANQEMKQINGEKHVRLVEAISQLEKRFENLEKRLAVLLQQNEQVMYKIIKLLDGE